MSVASKLLAVQTSSKWSLQKASFDNVSSSNTLFYGRQLFFNSAGDETYELKTTVNNTFTNIIYSSAWDITSSTSSTDITFEDTSGNAQTALGLCLANGRLFASINQGSSAKTVREFDFNGDYIQTSSHININGAIFINESGEYLYLGDNNSKVHVYTMSPGFDLSSLTFSSTIDLSSTIGAGQSIADIKVKPDGKRFFVQVFRKKCYEFRTLTPWDLSAAFYYGYDYQTDGVGFYIKPDGSKLFARNYDLNNPTYKIERHTLG
jgi:hypothetical protein